MTINHESVTPILEQIVPILQALKPYLYERWGITELAIFGSVARHNSKADSDIDILSNSLSALGRRNCHDHE